MTLYNLFSSLLTCFCDISRGTMFLFVPESMRGNDMLWIIGDNFTSRLFRAHSKLYSPESGFFIKENYEFKPFCSSRFASSNTNMLSRIVNTFAGALNSDLKSGGLLPRYVLFVLDDDLITYLNCKTSDGVDSLFGSWIEWLVKNINDMLQKRIHQLPIKSRKVIPFLYWVTAPIHSYFSKERNNLRIKFNLSLESVIREQSNMRVVKMKDYWDTKDSKLVINDRMTEVGLSAYWLAVEANLNSI